jgi:hypothetical protein
MGLSGAERFFVWRKTVKQFSAETRQRMSEAAKARCTPEWRERQSNVLSTQVDANEIKRLYESGLSQTEVAVVMGTTQKVIFNAMHKNGIQSRKAYKRNQTKENNDYWKGDGAAYQGFHARLYREKGKPKHCDICGTDDPSKTYDWANLTGNYADMDDYKRMCRPCHWKYDGRVKNITKEGMPNV